MQNTTAHHIPGALRRGERGGVGHNHGRYEYLNNHEGQGQRKHKEGRK